MAQVTQRQDMTAEISVFSFRRNDNSDVAVVTSRGRVFQILGPAVANERSPTVTRRDGRTSRRLVDDDRRRVLAGMSVPVPLSVFCTLASPVLRPCYVVAVVSLIRLLGFTVLRCAKKPSTNCKQPFHRIDYC